MSRPVSDKTRRRAAILREIALCGVYAQRAARLVGMTGPGVRSIAKRFHFAFADRRWSTPLRRAIVSGYRDRVPPAVIAEQLGTTENCVRATASRMGVTGRTDPARNKRPFLIPDDQWPRYRELRKLGLTYEECGYELGLLARPEAHQSSRAAA